MNETINNEIEMNEIETATELNIDNVIPLDYEVSPDEVGDGDVIAKVIIGACFAAAAACGIAYAKNKKNNGDKKDGFIKKMAVKYLTKKRYAVTKLESTTIDESEYEDDYDGLVPDKK